MARPSDTTLVDAQSPQRGCEEQSFFDTLAVHEMHSCTNRGQTMSLVGSHVANASASAQALAMVDVRDQLQQQTPRIYDTELRKRDS